MILQLSQLLGKRIMLTRRYSEATGVETFQFDAKGLRWEPGQYFVYMLPRALFDKRTMFRPFSAVTPPGEILQITTRMPAKLSKFKTALNRLKSGDNILAFGPYGRFIFDESKPHSAFLVGGIGITPVRAMLVRLAAQHSQAHITILYAAHDKNVIFKEELEKIITQLPNTSIHFLQNPQRLDIATIKQQLPNYKKTTFYVTGPKPMTKALTSLLKSTNIPRGQIKIDALKGYPWGA